MLLNENQASSYRSLVGSIKLRWVTGLNPSATVQLQVPDLVGERSNTLQRRAGKITQHNTTQTPPIRPRMYFFVGSAVARSLLRSASYKISWFQYLVQSRLPSRSVRQKPPSWLITKYKHFRPLLLRPDSPLINQHTGRKLHYLLNILSQSVS